MDFHPAPFYYHLFVQIRAMRQINKEDEDGEEGIPI